LSSSDWYVVRVANIDKPTWPWWMKNQSW
jgi:hypothetical protein